MPILHLLILDGDPERREALLGTLRAVGHHAVVAPDARAAAAAIGLPGFDALLLDLGLPQVNLGLLRQALAPADDAPPDTLEAAERRHITLALRHTGGNKRQAAHLLGISRSTLLHKVRKFGLAAGFTIVGLAMLVTGSPLVLAAQQDTVRVTAGPPGPVPAGRVQAGTLAFDGHATAGDFIGTTTVVTGEMTGGDSLGAVRGWVEAPVRTLMTGNGKRDRDLNKSMESEKYPAIRFELKGVRAATGTADNLPVTLEGTMTIHGVARQVTLSGFVRPEGDALRVHTDFPLVLTDYRIGGLSKMLGMLKMDEHIEVHVDVTFRRAP